MALAWCFLCYKIDWMRGSPAYGELYLLCLVSGLAAWVFLSTLLAATSKPRTWMDGVCDGIAYYERYFSYPGHSIAFHRPENKLPFCLNAERQHFAVTEWLQRERAVVNDTALLWPG